LRWLPRFRWRAVPPLTRRIVAVNVLPLALLAVGFLYLGKFESSLIGQQIESLRTQGEIFAAALSEGAVLDSADEGEVLLPDLSVPEFADMFAQTLAYGLFAARYNHHGSAPFQRLGAASEIPKTNPFLRDLFHTMTGPALNDLVAEHVDLIFMELSSALKLHEGGKARILAIASDKRLDILPDIPTMIEAGVPNFISDTWNAISAPPKTPRPIILKLNRAMNDILNEQDTKQRFRKLNITAAGGTPEDMAKLKKEETERWTAVIRAAGIQAE